MVQKVYQNNIPIVGPRFIGVIVVVVVVLMVCYGHYIHIFLRSLVYMYTPGSPYFLLCMGIPMF